MPPDQFIEFSLSLFDFKFPLQFTRCQLRECNAENAAFVFAHCCVSLKCKFKMAAHGQFFMPATICNRRTPIGTPGTSRCKSSARSSIDRSASAADLLDPGSLECAQFFGRARHRLRRGLLSF